MPRRKWASQVLVGWKPCQSCNCGRATTSVNSRVQNLKQLYMLPQRGAFVPLTLWEPLYPLRHLPANPKVHTRMQTEESVNDEDRTFR